MSLSPDFVAELKKHFSGEIRLDAASRVLYSTDASMYQVEPLGVALPRNQEDLHAAVELAARYQVPILPRGSGSSLAGQAIGQALILDCSRYLNKLVELNPEARTATAEPGLVLASLNRQAARHGLMFGPDPASAERATLGGVVGNNATGAHSILYGMTADHLLSADVILSDGSLAVLGEMPLHNNGQPSTPSRLLALHQAALDIRHEYAADIRARWPASWRNSAGYRLNYLLPWSPATPPLWDAQRPYPPVAPGTLNLAVLMAGSEGTLAVMRRVTLNLVPKPKHTVLAVLAYDSIAAACDDVPRLLGFSPSAVELVPQMLIQLARSVPAYARQMGWISTDPAALLVVEFSGANPAELEQKARSVGNILRVATDLSEQNQIWNVRKVGLGLFDSRPAAARPIAFIEDCAIPVEHLGDFVRQVERILAEHGTHAAIYAHASAGCLHIRPIIDLKQGSGVRALRSVAEQVLALTLRVGGSMSSEHGDGWVRSEWLRQTYGDALLEAVTRLKRAADPQSILNPGKIVAAPRMDANLRYGEAYTARPWQPALDFGRNGGLAAAIEQCNGQGVCRKDGGVMCPSFQATRDEMHSTRGRANLLRAMISLKPAGLPASQVKMALDLCLACKGCKAECPSGVDMAKLKYEFQGEYYKTHRRPLRDYLFGYINQLAPLAAPFGGLINRVGDWGWVRRLGTFFGLSALRPLPRFKRAIPRHASAVGAIETALFLPDTFTRYFEPEIEAAAMHLLAACGVDARPLPLLGAGRTLLSKGFIEPARHHAQSLLDEIRRLDPQGRMPVIGLEPSEIYTLRDELRDLLPERQAEVESLARRAFLIDEYLVRPGLISDKLRIANISRPQDAEVPHQKILLHGHCYQKAQPLAEDGYETGVNASAALLKHTGYEVEIIQSGCCGMAGAFGYEADHYEVSMKVGELVLFPTLRQNAGKQVAAAGTSCRSQIADGVGVAANHPVVLAARALL